MVEYEVVDSCELSICVWYVLRRFEGLFIDLRAGHTPPSLEVRIRRRVSRMPNQHWNASVERA